MIRGWLVGCAIIIAIQAEAQFKLYDQGLDAYKDQDYPRTINLLNDYIDSPLRDKALDVDVHYYLALSYYKTKSYTSAIREFDEALQLGHKNAGNIHWFMAKAYVELNAAADGLNEYGKALEIISDHPNHAKLLYERAMLYDKTGNKELAMNDLVEASTTDPDNADVKKAISERSSGKSTVVADSKSVSKNNGPALKNEKRPPKALPVAAVAAEISNAEPSIAEQFKNEKRYALVIGNAKYQNVAPLRNSENDANDIAAELEKSNFEVIKVINGTYNDMREAFKKFHAKLSTGPKDQTVGLFYYAGHGIQYDGENYLVPVEANVQYDDDIPRACMAVQRIIMANMERSNSRMNIVILDACRNNPFPSAYRSTEAGLTEIKRAKGSFIAYATAPGYVASDGEGRNGLYTQELLKAMRQPGRTIEQVFKDVRKNVLKLSGDRQYTWDSSNIIGDFYFKY